MFGSAEEGALFEFTGNVAVPHFRSLLINSHFQVRNNTITEVHLSACILSHLPLISHTQILNLGPLILNFELLCYLLSLA